MQKKNAKEHFISTFFITIMLLTLICSLQTSFAIIPTNSTIEFNPNPVVLGGTIVISGIATDQNGGVLANEGLYLNIDGVDTYVVTDVNGFWSFDYTASSLGTIDVSISWFNGDENYNSFVNSSSFLVVDATINNPNNSNNSNNSNNPIPNPNSSLNSSPDLNLNPILNNPYNLNIGEFNSNDTNSHSNDENEDEIRELILGDYEDLYEDDSNKPSSNVTAKTIPMKNTGMPVIAIIVLCLTIVGISFSRKQKR
ncbi:MAG: hypothetical protein FWH29_06165 [Methanobrevibacter sp.]|nr:hypothetical protein [Methanobrevibacter sp.]